jgi:hypothetical protein
MRKVYGCYQLSPCHRIRSNRQFPSVSVRLRPRVSVMILARRSLVRSTFTARLSYLPAKVGWPIRSGAPARFSRALEYSQSVRTRRETQTQSW